MAVCFEVQEGAMCAADVPCLGSVDCTVVPTVAELIVLLDLKRPVC